MTGFVVSWPVVAAFVLVAGGLGLELIERAAARRTERARRSLAQGRKRIGL